MGIMQLINVFLFWLFFGLLTAHFAKKRGRRPILWFFAGVFLGILGVLLVIVLPKPQPKKRPQTTLIIQQQSETWLKMWYYLDPTHAQQGPFEFHDLVKSWKEKHLTENSLIWGEGMKEWKRLSDLPEIVQEMEQG